VLAAELFGKPVDSGRVGDSTVRVRAALRDKLREYYFECPREPVIIMPKGSCVPPFGGTTPPSPLVPIAVKPGPQ
jgi:hypothetical protein